MDELTRFPSRRYSSADSFEDFLETLTPGVIPRDELIKWDDIAGKLASLAPSVEFYSELKKRAHSVGNLCGELADNSLLASDDPLPYVQGAFELLGHTNNELVTKQDDTAITEIAAAIEAQDERAATGLAQLLWEIGFDKVLSRDDLEDVLLGVQIGLETHRRKNIGGKCFRNEVKDMLTRVAADLARKTRQRTNLLEEEEILYAGGLSKRVDFAITVGSQATFGFEANFYTVSGSKPTEIKRSYGQIRRGLLDAGVDLIWLTDGKGYRKMKRSLRDAYVIFPNIYNLQQAENYLASDLAAALGGIR